jgi:hypothetical protein
VRRAVRSIEAAAIAGIVFSAGFIVGLILLSRTPGSGASAAEIVAFYEDPGRIRPVIAGLQIIPIAAIGLLWFIAVVRRRIGDREDKLFSTVFLGGGLMYTAMVLVGSAAVAAPAVVTSMGDRPLEPDTALALRAFGISLYVVHASRLGSLFILSASTLGLRSGAFPRVISFVGYALGLSLILPLPIISPFRFVFPAWVGIISIFLLIRRGAVPSEPAGAPPGGPRPGRA